MELASLDQKMIILVTQKYFDQSGTPGFKWVFFILKYRL